MGYRWGRCLYFYCMDAIGVPTAASLPSSFKLQVCTDRIPEKKTVYKVLGLCRWWMINRWLPSHGGCSVYPVQSTAGYVLFSQPVTMSHMSIHDHVHDHDHHQASSTTSLMGIDAVASTDETHERTVLLDVERDSAQYGTTTQPNNGGADSILYWLLSFTVSILS